MVALGLVGIGRRELSDALVKAMLTGCDGQLVARRGTICRALMIC